jgi:putative intracellular protease/amidase
MSRSIHLFVFDTLADWEPGYVTAGINNPEGQKQPGRYGIRTVGPSRDPVTTTGGIRILPDMSLDELRPAESAMLILPGGDIWDRGRNTAAVEKARMFLESNVPVAAICGATSGLARGGMLDTRKHTSNASGYLAATGYRGGHLYQEADVVIDQNVITASAMKSLEFAREIFRVLDLYEERVLQAWYGLFKTGDARYYAELTNSSHPE